MDESRYPVVEIRKASIIGYSGKIPCYRFDAVMSDGSDVVLYASTEQEYKSKMRASVRQLMGKLLPRKARLIRYHESDWDCHEERIIMV